MSGVAINIIGSAYSDDALPLAAQECINFYPETVLTDGARNVIALKGTPGLKTFATVGSGTLRGALVMAGTLYVVADTSLYSVDSAGVATSLGTIEGNGRVGMSENGIQLVVVNGVKGWVYNKNTAVFAQITDADFAAADTCAFLDQYVIFNKKGSDQFFISALADATSFDALDFASTESATDTLLGVLVDHRELWCFGQGSIEVWQNTGAADFPFERLSGATIQRGAASAFAFAQLDNGVFWLGDDGVAYRANGYQPQRISTLPIEQAIRTETLSEAFVMAYTDGGHPFFVVSFPNGKTWVYDAATNLWHRRKSYEINRWRGNVYVRAYNKHLMGDFTAGKLWEMSDTTYLEGTDPLIAERKTQYFHNEGNWIFGHELELFFDAGRGLTTGQGSDPKCDLRYSDDGGRNWSNWRQGSLGKRGEYARRMRFHRLGRFRQRLFHIRVSDPVPRTLIAASARFTT